MSVRSVRSRRGMEVDVSGVIAYQAPFLIERLVKKRIADSEREGAELFDEVKKYIIMGMADDSISWQMYSSRIDEVWHQFILFTEAYTRFCEEYFGGYIRHSPNNAPELKRREPRQVAAAEASSFGGFRKRYRELFGAQLPDIWYDEKNVTTARRVVKESVGPWTLRDEGSMVELLDERGEMVLAASEAARDALGFIAETGAFYVRELPGDLTDREKVALAGSLVECKLLCVAA